MKIWFLDSGNIFIRLTDKCSANCERCWLSSLSFSKKISFDFYENIENFIAERIFGNYSITFLWYDIFGNYDFDFIEKISFWKNVQLSFRDVELYQKEIQKLSQENNVKFFVILTINSLYDLKNILTFLKSEHKFVNLTIVCDLNKYVYFLQKIFPGIKNKSFQYFTVNWNQIEIENLSFNILMKNQCKSLENFKIENDNIYVKMDLNIWHNGDISFHLNQWCNNSIKKITDIFSENILQDFKDFREYLLENNNKKDRCLNCNYFVWKKF